MKIRICGCSCRRRGRQNAKDTAADDGGSYMRSFRLYVPRIILSVFVFLLGIDAAAAENLPAQTIVVFNTAVPDSEALAKFYAGKRGIADDHVVGLDCPSEEEISREQYDASIAEPLRKIFEQRQWWHVHEAPDGESGCRPLGFTSSLSSRACLLRYGPLRRLIRVILLEAVRFKAGMRPRLIRN
jgi:hypothetical protein